MFLSFGVEGNDATVEKVEGDADTRVVLNTVPIVWMAVDILKDDQGLLITLLEQAMVISLDGHKGHIDIGSLINHHSLTTSCLEVVAITQPVNDGGGLSVVDKPEIESSQLATHPVIILSQLLIGIVRPRLVDDIPLEAVVCRRLDAEASAVTNTTEPNTCLQ